MNSINLSREMRPALWSVKTTAWGSLFHWDSSNSSNAMRSALCAMPMSDGEQR